MAHQLEGDLRMSPCELITSGQPQSNKHPSLTGFPNPNVVQTVPPIQSYKSVLPLVSKNTSSQEDHTVGRRPACHSKGAQNNFLSCKTNLRSERHPTSQGPA